MAVSASFPAFERLVFSKEPILIFLPPNFLSFPNGTDKDSAIAFPHADEESIAALAKTHLAHSGTSHKST